jgi:hypothetical protein
MSTGASSINQFTGINRSQADARYQPLNATLTTLSGKSFQGSGAIVLATAPTITTPALSLTDAVLNDVSVVTDIVHRSSGTPVTNFGTKYRLRGDNASNVVSDMASIRTFWNSIGTAFQNTTVVIGFQDTGVEVDALVFDQSQMRYQSTRAAAAVQFLIRNLSNNATSDTRLTIANDASVNAAIISVPSSAAGTDPNSLKLNVNSDNPMIFQTSGNEVFRIKASAGKVTFSDQMSLAFSTVTGSKIGTATGQKISFWNATPIVQPVGAGQAAVVTTASTQTTPWGFSTQSQADAIVTLVNALRTALVNTGLIKGAA